MADTDLDALIEELGQAHLNLSFAFYQDDEWFTRGRTGKTGTISANLRRAEVAREALRARLAPPSAQQVTQEAWRALSMIREVVEQMGVGLMPAGEHTLPPTLAREAEVIVAALARLAAPAPTTHADDEALLRLPDVIDVGSLTLNGVKYVVQSKYDDAVARAETAERALAECRAKTIEDACAALKAKQAMLIDVGCDGPVVNAFSSAMGVIRALKKEPRDA